MRALDRKKTCFFGNALPKSIVRAHLKQGKKHSGLQALYLFDICWIIRKYKPLPPFFIDIEATMPQ